LTASGTAVVAEVAWVNGLGAIRSLGRAGVRVLALDHRRSALGFRSRYATPVVAPDPLADERAFVNFLADFAERIDGPTPLFATHDEHLNAVVRHADRLGEAFPTPAPPWEILERVQRKRYQLEAAAEIGVPVPETRHPRSEEEALTAGRELGFPLLVKPSDNVVFKRLYRRQAFYCRDEAELREAYARAGEYEPMVQEFIGGGDEGLFTLGSYVAPDGEALALFCGRKLRQTREHMGSCRVGESLWVDEVVEQGLALLRHTGFHGISQVEFKRDPRDGRYRLIEINPRLWQWHSLAEACGVNIPHIAYRDVMGDRPAPVRMRHEGKRWSISFMFQQSSALLWPPYVDGVFARDDPRPALYQAARFARRGLRRLTRG
jgi:D-aspartate ligase